MEIFVGNLSVSVGSPTLVNKGFKKIQGNNFFKIKYILIYMLVGKRIALELIFSKLFIIHQ